MKLEKERALLNADGGEMDDKRAAEAAMVRAETAAMLAEEVDEVKRMTQIVNCSKCASVRLVTSRCQGPSAC